MNIFIEEISGDIVKFSSEQGNGFAVWKGEKIGPKQNRTVEIEIDEIFVLGKNIFLSSEEKLRFLAKEDELEFFVKKISYDKDDLILAVSLGNDIILLEADEADWCGENLCFSVSQHKVFLYPFVI